ncbi:MAG: histidinol-phosphate transaminase [Candidatus Hadarchaeota archaeon]
MISRRVKALLESRGPYPLAKKYDVRGPKFVNLASNESPYGPSPKVVRSLKEELSFISRYPDPGARRLKFAIANYLEVGPDCLVVGNGSDELMDLICKAFVDSGDRVLIPTPTFDLYEISAILYGGKPLFFRLEPPDFEWREEELARAAKGTKLAFLGRPNNPTGNGIGLAGLRKVLKDCKLVVLDEAYVDFSDGSATKLAAKEKNMIVLRTFSKAFGLAGVRVGYAVGNPELIRVIERVRAPFNVSRPAQAAAIAALKDLPYVKKVVGVIKSEREYLSRELGKIGLRPLPSKANFLMVDLSKWKTESSKFCDILAKRGILVRDLSAFRGAGRNYIRITVGTPEQDRRLMQELQKLRVKICR